MINSLLVLVFFSVYTIDVSKTTSSDKDTLSMQFMNEPLIEGRYAALIAGWIGAC
jgi:hypothetical protein